MKNVLSGLRVLSLLAALPLVGVACDDGSGGSPSGGGPSGGTSSSSSGSSGTTTPPDDEPSCPTTTTGPTVHSGDVAADEVWTAETGPHVVERTVNVRGGVKLTIAPCAEVRVKAGQYLQVAYPTTPNTGSLVAEGTAKRPIRIVGEEGARWSSLAVHAGGSARLAHVTFENGGGGDFQESATIAAYGDSEDGADPLLFADHVTVKGSLGTGVWLTRGATFVEGSKDLVVTGSGNDAFPYPLVIEEHAFDTLPTGTYTGNKVDEIMVDPAGGRTAGSGLLADGTVHDRGVPYHVGRSTGDSLRIGGRPDGKLVTMTIEPGVTMKFMPGAALKIQHFTNLEPSTAALRAIGTAAKPIVFTSASEAPAPGAWMGLWYGGVPDASNRLDHVKIAYAGGDCGCILLTCSDIAQYEGAVIFSAQPPSAFITNTSFSNIAGHGVTQGFDGELVDFKPTNTFEALSGCPQTLPRFKSRACSNPKPACE